MSDSSLLRDVRARLQRYLLDMETLREFHQWFVPVAWKLRNSGGADRTVRGIELRLAEYKRGDWTEPQLRAKLQELLPGTVAAGAPESDTWEAEGSPFQTESAITK
jgi:hypothetical protein